MLICANLSLMSFAFEGGNFLPLSVLSRNDDGGEPKDKGVVPTPASGNKKRGTANTTTTKDETSKKLRTIDNISQAAKGKGPVESVNTQVWDPKGMVPPISRPIEKFPAQKRDPSRESTYETLTIGVVAEGTNPVVNVPTGATHVPSSSQPPSDLLEETARGRVWMYPYPVKNLDSCNVYLPFYEEMRKAITNRPPELRDFAKEVFHAFEPLYVGRRMEKDPASCLHVVLGRLFETWCMVGRTLDDIIMRKEELIIPKDDARKRIQAELKRSLEKRA